MLKTPCPCPCKAKKEINDDATVQPKPIIHNTHSFIHSNLDSTCALVLAQGLGVMATLSTLVAGATLAAVRFVAGALGALGEFGGLVGAAEVVVLWKISLVSCLGGVDGAHETYIGATSGTVGLVRTCLNGVVALGSVVGVLRSARHFVVCIEDS